MRIAFFSDAFFPQINGVVNHLSEIVTRLSENHEIIIVAPKKIGGNIPSFKLSSSHIEYVPGIPAFVYPDWYVTLPFSFKIQNIVRNFNPDIIHFHTPHTIGRIGINCARILKKPLVGTFHGYFMEPEYLKIIHLDRLGYLSNKLINYLGWAYTRSFFNKCDAVISPSKFSMNDLVKHGVTRPISIIPNGFMFQKKYKINTLKNVLPKRYFLYVGRLSLEKNIETVILAFKEACKILKEEHLIIVGDGPALSYLKKISQSTGIGKRIHFLGAIPYSQLISSDIYPKALAFITASASEMQPMSIIEAYHFKLPLILANARGSIELVNNNGFLCETNNLTEFKQSMIILATNEKLRKKFSLQSKKMSFLYDTKKTVFNLEKLYASLL